MWWKILTVKRHRMSRVVRSSIVLLMAVVLIAGAGIALAAEEDVEETPPDDTLLNLGYDEDNHIFLVNTSATDSTYDCTLEDDTLSAEYGAADNARIPVDMLLDEDREAFVFPNRPADQVGSDFTPADEPVAYAGADVDCGISGGVVAGPNGQINHGQFMKLFHQLVDMRGRGCLNRIIARSGLGKGDQQLRTSDVDPAFEPGASGQVDFTTLAADCDRHEKNGGNNTMPPTRGRRTRTKSRLDPTRPATPATPPATTNIRKRTRRVNLQPLSSAPIRKEPHTTVGRRDHSHHGSYDVKDP